MFHTQSSLSIMSEKGTDKQSFIPISILTTNIAFDLSSKIQSWSVSKGKITHEILYFM